MLTVEQALERVLSAFQPLEPERVPILNALDRVLAEDITAGEDIPPHANSSMDGYAVLAADTSGASGDHPARLRIVGEIAAGHIAEATVTPGTAVRIMTGAPVPEGADAVVKAEVCEEANGVVAVSEPVAPRKNVGAIGEDIRRGELALDAGTTLRPAELGLLASVGVGEVSVWRRPRVAILSTGDELRPIGEQLAPGQIYDSNRYSLHGMLQRLGLEVIDLGVVPDTREDTLRAFESAAARADAIVTSGGVSVGEADYVTETLERHGRIGFWKVAMKPGKPIAFGRFGQAYFFGLPGNPVTVMVTFYQLVQPALRALTGATGIEPPLTVRATCESRLRKKPGRLEFQRGVLTCQPSGGYVVRSTGHQGAGVLRSMSEANCFMVLPLEQGDVEPGSEVEVQPFVGLV